MELDAQWIVGFTDGEGCFHVGINRNKTMVFGKANAQGHLGFQVLPELTIVQHEKNIKVLYALKDFFQCGVVRRNHGDRFAYRVRGQANLTQKVIPFFEKHQLKTSKRVDFQKFRKVVRMIEQKQHLTKEGLEQIQKIKQVMNRTPQRERDPAPCECFAKQTRSVRRFSFAESNVLRSKREA